MSDSTKQQVYLLLRRGSSWGVDSTEIYGVHSTLEAAETHRDWASRKGSPAGSPLRWDILTWVIDGDEQ